MVAAEDTGADGYSHRPLPSIDVPLLRREVRARRWRIAMLGVLGGVVVAGAVAGAIYIGRLGKPRGPRAPTIASSAIHAARVDAGSFATTLALIDATPRAHALEPDRTTNEEATAAPSQGSRTGVEVAQNVRAQEPTSTGSRTTHPFGTAPSFRDALTRIGISAADSALLITALESVLDFRRCRPEDEIVIERGTSGALSRFEYHAALTHYVRATRSGTRFRAERVDVPVDRVRIARGGRVTSSLGDALDGLGLGRSLVGMFVEVLDGRFNFTSDTRAGDTFRVIVDEERIHGELVRYGIVHALEYQSARRGPLRAFWFERRDLPGDYYTEEARALHGGWLRTPLRYEHVSSPFDPRRMHPILRRVMPHTGIDFAAASGTPVWAGANGRIAFVGDRGPNGNLVAMTHAGGYESYYAHLSRFATGLRVGQEVAQRTVIGYVGSTGRSTAPHLHFGLKRWGRWIDPARELHAPGRPLASAYVPEFRRVSAALTAELGRIAIETPSPVTRREAPPVATESADEEEEIEIPRPAPVRRAPGARGR